MNKYFIDTNLFLRYLTNDIPKQADFLTQLMQSAKKGNVKLVSHSIVIAEIVWTLGSFYKYQKNKIDEVVSSIVGSELFDIKDKDIILQALEDFHTLNIDYADAFIGAWMIENKLTDIATLNKKDFKRIPGLTIIEAENF